MAAPSAKEIRDQYSYFADEWREIYDEGKTDMRYVAGDPWEPADRKAREDAGRPCISLDELSQYLNQAINNVRQNKRAVQALPTGDGANDKDGERRENIIRGIEYRSQAQGAYLWAFENGLQRSYGFAGLTTRYVGESFDQEIRVKRFPNSDAVLIDPDYREADASDIKGAFVLDMLRKAEFKRRFKNAKPQSFTAEGMREAPGWIRDNYIQVAEYWKISMEQKKIFLIDSPQGPVVVDKDELEQLRQGKRTGRGQFLKMRDAVDVKRERTVEIPKVAQYITNGLETLEETPWAGSRIPICACFGKELFFDDGSGPKRKLLSMVRLARDAQMLHAYLASQECEEAGLTPRATFVGAKGQFESDSETWETITKFPHAYAQYDPVVDAASGQVLPPPSRPQFEPNFQAYELAKESARRSIQAGMGSSPLPTDAQRQNQKSGIALEKINASEAIGSFHFTDNYDRFLSNIGWQMNELITPVYDTARDVPVSMANGKHAVMRINDRKFEQENPGEDHLHTDKGKYGVTISTGPSYQSQREQADEFVDKIIENLQTLPVPPQIASKILALAIRMKELGATGNSIADLLDPPDQNNLPPAAQAAIAQLQGQIQQLSQENQALHMERAGKVLEQQTKVHIEGMRGKNTLDKETMNFITQIVKAELAAKSKATDQQAQLDADKELSDLGFHHDQIDRAHTAAHEVGMQGIEHAHQKDLADRQAQTASAQQATQIAADQQAQEQQPAQ